MQRFKTQALVLGGLLVLMWLVEVLDYFILDPMFSFSLRQYGIVPRHLIGLRGIIFAPFLHAGFAHLLSNSVPFLVLGWLVMLRGGISEFVGVSVTAALVGGLGTWVIGTPAVHIGASGVIFGYLGFLLMAAYFDRRPLAIILALVVAGLYGGLLRNVLPGPQGVSWESHACGLLGGALAARLAAPARRLLTAKTV